MENLDNAALESLFGALVLSGFIAGGGLGRVLSNVQLVTGWRYYALEGFGLLCMVPSVVTLVHFGPRNCFELLTYMFELDLIMGFSYTFAAVALPLMCAASILIRSSPMVRRLVVS